MSTFLHAGRPGQIFIKVCGLTNLSDAALCTELGVNAVGFLLQPEDAQKPRSDDEDRLSIADAISLVAGLPNGLLPVLLLHTVELATILKYCETIRPGALQVQKPVSPTDLAQVRKAFPGIAVIKKFSVVPGTTTLDSMWSEISRYTEADAIDAILLDSKLGGRGEVHDWPLSAQLVQRSASLPIILAGGLKPHTVGEAIRTVRPFGADVMSAVTQGRERRAFKDATALRAFVQAVREGSVQ